MHPIVRPLAIALFALLAFAGTASAQSIFRPFHIRDGYNAAYDKARDTLAADAYLVYAGTFGEADLSEYGVPGTLNFYQDIEGPQGQYVDPGQADAWGYVFYSPSRQRTVNLVVVNTFITGGFYAMGLEAELPLPDQLVDRLDLTLSGASGDSLMARVKRDAVFAQYHEQYPMKQPDVVSLGLVVPDDVPVPSEFVMDGPTWTMTYGAEGDTAGMVCVVSVGSGQTICNITTPSSAPNESVNVSLNAYPNPSTGMLRLELTGHISGDIRFELLDAGGRVVRDLAPSPVAGALRHASVNVSDLPTGAYFCRLSSDGVSRVLPVSIVGN